MMSSENRERGIVKLKEIAGDRAVQTLSDWREIAPHIEDYILGFICGDVLSRPGLDSKTRQLLTVTGLTALAKYPEELKMHLHGALNVGWKKE